MNARWTIVFIKLILRLREQNDPHRVYEPVNFGLGLVDGWLVGFYGISTFVGYFTPNPFLCK